ncbi:MAG: hypothetical protein AB1631_05700 [Acidobacteriota bacterium]
MSRLDFAPNPDQIKITDIKRGIGIFKPRSDKPVSFAAIKTALKKAGYTLDSSEITVAGLLMRDGAGWRLEVPESKQRFHIESDKDQLTEGAQSVEITGEWQTVDEREVIRISSAKKADGSKYELRGVQVSLEGVGDPSGIFFAPVRTTSPGLTVYKGGAVIPRYIFTAQHIGNLKVDRHALRVGVSYTPTTTLQMEAEIPFQSVSFDNGARSGSGRGLGNIIFWGKHRFYRQLETWGDRQAAIRFGLELPTGRKTAPPQKKLDAPEFLRQQITPIEGGLSLHLDAAFSQAKRRWIYGANIETIARGERDGFRLGHELRINTDLEYVLLPRDYRAPEKELFLILETTSIVRSRGRLRGATVPGSSATEFRLAPALQFTLSPQIVIEASYQFPIIRNTGPMSLRTDRNLIVGMRYLY